MTEKSPDNLDKNARGADPGVDIDRTATEPEADKYSIEEPVDLAKGKSYSQGQLVRRRFFRHKGALVAMVLFVVIFVIAFTSIGIGKIPGWWGKDFTSTYDVVNPQGAPTMQLWPFTIGKHPFGQDTIGKDYFALVMRGTQISLIIALLVGLISTLLGTAVGAAAGYFRGWVEAALMRLTDFFIVIPLLVLAAVLGQIAQTGIIVGGVTLFPGGVPLLAVMLGLTTWTGLARLVRGEVLSLREREFVSAARAIGTSSWKIVMRHILPNAIGTIIVSATLAIASAILLETSLSFLGFGVQQPDTSLGRLISEYQNSSDVRPWLFWWPGIFILGIALSVNFIGDGLRDAFDPRQTNKEK